MHIWGYCLSFLICWGCRIGSDHRIVFKINRINFYFALIKCNMGFPGGASGKEPACWCRRHNRRGFDPGVGKIPWRRAWQPTSEFLPGESPWTEEPGGLQSMGSQRVEHDWTTKHSTVSHLLLAKLRLLAKIWTSMSRAIRKEVCIYWAKYCIRLFSLLLAHGIFMTTIWNRYDYSYFCKGENWGSKISWDSYPGEPISKVIRMWSLDKTSVSRAKARRR